MGILDRWTKKKNQETLQGMNEASDASVVSEKPKAKQIKAAGAKVVKAKSKEKIVKKEPTMDEVVTDTKEEKVKNKIIVKAWVTEKAAHHEILRQYCFKVATHATKDQVKRAVEEVYGVKPVSVNIINNEGKRVRFGKSMGRRSDFKKAMVTLAKGKTISIHEGV